MSIYVELTRDLDSGHWNPGAWVALDGVCCSCRGFLPLSMSLITDSTPLNDDAAEFSSLKTPHPRLPRKGQSML
jgi:hypothetical protein